MSPLSPILTCVLLAAPAAAQCNVFEINPGAGSGDIAYLTSVFGDTLMFSARDPNLGVELFKWTRHGGVELVKDMNEGSGHGVPWHFVECCTASGSLAFFDGYLGLWVSDGTAGGTRLVRDPSPAVHSKLVAGDGHVFFGGGDRDTGSELWVSDGTATGTRLVADLEPGPAGSVPNALTGVGHRVVFTIHKPAIGRELWVSDGTTAGTGLLADINPGSASSNIQLLTPAGSVAYFSANDGIHGNEPWVTDGTPEGTRMLADVEPGVDGCDPGHFVELDGIALFTADAGRFGSELWRSDGTPAGTFMLRDIRVGAFGSGPRFMTRVGALVYFAAHEYSTRLWVTDGTVEGTRMVDEPQTGPIWNPRFFVPAGDGFLFVADDASGTELWFSDGTGAGTRQVCDVDPGAGSSSPDLMTVCDGSLLFRGNTPATGRELFQLPNAVAMHHLLGVAKRPDEPTLTIRDDANPVLGSTIDLIASGPAGYSGMLTFSDVVHPLPPIAGLMDGGCDWVGAQTGQAFVLMTSPSSFSTPIAIPDDAALSGARLRLQAWWVSLTGSPILRASNGIQLHVGRGTP